jgi:predicted ATPase
MIKSVRLVNFFSFGDCTIDLESDLNVLVGINGSGKSNFLRAFQLLKAGMDGRLREQIIQWGGINFIKRKNTIGASSRRDVELNFFLDLNSTRPWDDGYKGIVIYKLFFLGSGNDYTVDESVTRLDGGEYFDSLGGSVAFSSVGSVDAGVTPRKNIGNGKELVLAKSVSEYGLENLELIHEQLRSIDLYKGFNTNDDAPMRNAVRATGFERLLQTGDNVFQVLNITSLVSAPSYDAIEAGLHDVNENFQRFRMNVYGQGSVEFYLQEKGLETPIHAAQVSDGTLCYLCLLVALHQSERGNTILFDEPERNLHPDMLFELAKQLEKASEKSQIILTTHAPGLLNQFPLRAVRVFEKDENNQTIVKKFTEEDFAGWYDEFAPGQMWRNGDLGGNRY